MEKSLQFVGVLLLTCWFLDASAVSSANTSREIPGAPPTGVQARTVVVQWLVGCANCTDEDPILCGPDNNTKLTFGEQYGMTYSGDSFGGWSAYVAPTVADANSAIEEIAKEDSPLVKTVAADYQSYIAVMPLECPNGVCGSLYGMNLINAPLLWNRLVAVPNVGAAATVRRGCVIDSGIRFNHLDLTPSVLAGASRTIVTLNAAANTITPATGGDITFPGPDGPNFTSGHGTHVAGILAGVWNAVPNDGIAGVNGENVRVASCRVFDDQGPSTTNADVGQCITHAVTQNLLVINLSLGGGAATAPTVYRDAIQAACNAGAIVVVAAGNGVRLADGSFQGINIAGMTAATSPTGEVVDPIWPANFAGTLNCVLTVASVDSTSTLARSSNYGNNVQIAAPGVRILSDINLPMTNTDPTAPLSGTSMAAPHVAGSALLLYNAFPAATNLDVINCLVSTATRRTTPNFPTQTINGGILDVNAAYDCLAQRFGVSCRATPLTVDLPRAGTCASATIPNADLYTAAPGVGVAVSPSGPYAPGTYTITVTPNNGAAPCQVQLTVRACPTIECRDTTVQLTNTAPGSCDRADVPVASLFTGGPPGVVVSAMPVSPYSPGVTVVTVTPTNPSGLASCRAAVTVLPCKPACQDVTTDTCANPRLCTATINSNTFVRRSSIGSTSTGILLSPDNPYRLGTTSVRATAIYPAINGGSVIESVPSDPCRVTVTPCRPRCRNVQVNTTTSLCTGSVAPDAFIDSLSVGECALPLTDANVIRNPPSPYRLGTTTVIATVRYPNGIVSQATNPCTVTVVDRELPRITPINRCLVVDKFHKKETMCYTVPGLASVSDNCPGVVSGFTECRVSPQPKDSVAGSGKLPPLCSLSGPGQVCAALGLLKPQEPRTVTVTVRARDASGNVATNNTVVTLNGDLGNKETPPNCSRV